MNQLERISDCKDLDVTFVHFKGQAHHHFHRSLPITYPNPWETGIQPENLTMALCTLLEDPLDISSYGRQATQIYLQLDGREGPVMFQGGIWGNEGKRKRRFAIRDGGKTLAWITDITYASFASLPENVKSSIFTMANDAWYVDNNRGDDLGKVTWDLNAKTMTGVLPYQATINQEMRHYYETDIWEGQQHCLRLINNGASMEPAMFQPLEDFFMSWERSRSIWCTQPRARPETESSLTIEMNFRVASETSLEDIRLNVADLLRVNGSKKGSTKLTISVTLQGLRCVSAQSCVPKEKTIYLQELRTAANANLLEYTNEYAWLSLPDSCAPMYVNGNFKVEDLGHEQSDRFTQIDVRTKP